MYGLMSLDFVLVIRADRVDVYCNPYNYPTILPYIAHWRRLHIHCMSSEKVLSDLITQGCKTLYGCYSVNIPHLD